MIVRIRNRACWNPEAQSPGALRLTRILPKTGPLSPTPSYFRKSTTILIEPIMEGQLTV